MSCVRLRPPPSSLEAKRFRSCQPPRLERRHANRSAGGFEGWGLFDGYERTATCCCGQASILVEGEPNIQIVCHCNNCKKRTGSAFGISAYFADTQVRSKRGATAIYEIDTTETKQERHFCKFCGTTLYWKIYRFPGIPDPASFTGIAGGCFVENPLPAPTLTANNNGKCAWLELPKLKAVDPGNDASRGNA